MVDFHHDPHLFLKIKKISCSKGHQICFPDHGICSDFTGRCFYYLYLKTCAFVYS